MRKNNSQRTISTEFTKLKQGEGEKKQGEGKVVLACTLGFASWVYQRPYMSRGIKILVVRTFDNTSGSFFTTWNISDMLSKISNGNKNLDQPIWLLSELRKVGFWKSSWYLNYFQWNVSDLTKNIQIELVAVSIHLYRTRPSINVRFWSNR